MYFVTLLLACCAVELARASELSILPSEEVEKVFLGVQNLEKATLNGIFLAVGDVLKTNFRHLFGLITALVPGDSKLKLAKLMPELKALKEQKLQPIMKRTLELLHIKKILFTEKLVPRELLNVKINVDELIKSFTNGKSFITLADFLNAISESVAKVYTPVF